MKQDEDSDSDSNEIYSNFIARFHTSKSCKKELYLETDSSDDSEIVSNPEKIQRQLRSKSQDMQDILKHQLENSESDSDERFSNFISRICTPKSQNKKHELRSSDEDSDQRYSNFIGRFCTSELENKKYQLEDSDSDSDDLNFILRIRTPKLEKKRCSPKKEKNSLLPTVLKTCTLPDSVVSSNDKLASAGTTFRRNEAEFNDLFPARFDDSLFYQKREFYTHTLYEFFNRKVFDCELPPDMSLLWAESLVKSAGITCPSIKDGVYMCLIRLSSKILITFDRLKDTLLHEMCHAAVWIINKSTCNHGPLWQTWASRCNLILPFIEYPAICHTYDVSYRFWYQCTNCNWKRGGFRRSKRYHGAVCSKCSRPITITTDN